MMNIDELIRISSYALLSPGFFYLGIVARNRGHGLMAIGSWMLSTFFLLLLVGLVLLRTGQVYPPLLYINTVVVSMLAAVVGRLCWHFLQLSWQERK